MNKVRVIGLAALIIGVVIQFTIENIVTNYMSALLIGLGVGLLIVGRIRKPAD